MARNFEERKSDKWKHPSFYQSFNWGIRRTPGVSEKSVIQELILKIEVEGKVGDITWMVSLPSKPATHEEDAALFKECFNYVQARIRPRAKNKGTKKKSGAANQLPLRATFNTGGRDGIYFPTKLTSLQKNPSDVDLYIFNRPWLNDHLNDYGFEHRGFDLTNITGCGPKPKYVRS